MTSLYTSTDILQIRPAPQPQSPEGMLSASSVSYERSGSTGEPTAPRYLSVSMTDAVYAAVGGGIWSFEGLAYWYRDFGFDFVHALFWMHNALWVSNAMRRWKLWAKSHKEKSPHGEEQSNGEVDSGLKEVADSFQEGMAEGDTGISKDGGEGAIKSAAEEKKEA